MSQNEVLPLRLRLPDMLKHGMASSPLRFFPITDVLL